MRKSKKPTKATGGKRSKGQAAPRAAKVTGSQGNTPPPGTTLPAVIPPALDMSSPPVRAEIALIQRQQKQRWTKLPKKSKIKAKVAAIISMKVQGMSTDEIATQLGLKPASIRQYMWIAGKMGWLTTHDPHDVAENVLVHRAVSNLEELLHSRNIVTGLPDKDVTLETIKGLGIFKDYSKQPEQANQQANVLTINFLTPPGGQLPAVRVDNVGGQPAYVEAEIVAPPRLSVLDPRLKAVFTAFPNDNIAIIGSAAINVDSANDIDVLFLTDESFKRAVISKGAKYNGWDRNGQHVRRANVTIEGAYKPVQLTQNSTHHRFEDYPYALVLRDGTIIHEGQQYDKQGS